MAARGFIGAGDIYINRIIGGVKQGMEGPFYANKFEIKPNVDRKEQTSKGRNNYGQVLETVNLAQPADFTMEFAEVNKQALVLAFLGTESAVSQTGATLTDEAVVTDHDKWVDIGHAKLTGTIVVKNEAGSTTYVEGTDYVLNKELGWIKTLSTGTIADAATVEISGDYASFTGTKIVGATNTDVRAEIVFDGINQADGLPCICRVWETSIAADSAFDFLADDFNVVSLPGTLKTPSGKTGPFEVELRNT